MEGKKLTPEDLEAELKKLNIEYILHKHTASFNMEEMKQNVQLKHAPLIKNLFSKDKKSGACYLVSAHIDTKIEKAWYKKVGTNYNNCRMADSQVLEEVLGVQGGSVTPFGLINDHGKKVSYFVLDQTLLNHEWLAFHPLKNDATLELKRDDFFKFIESIGRKYTALNLSETEEKVEKKEEKPKEETKENKDTGETKLSISAKKHENFSEWYQEVITKGDLIEYYEISGCFILRPYAFSIWETIQKYCDTKFADMGVENSYFPLFVTERALYKEKEHLEGFSPEVAWVTRYSKNELKEPIAIRPTSETIMYDAYAKWIKSHRDLPLKLNQWTNVVRWEFKDPTPFIRTREFLWQEGHTAHATLAEADAQTYEVIELYRHIYEDLYAVPVIKGVKTKSETFAGALYSTTVEAYIPANYRAVQASTSHNLGQNFAKMFEIEYLDEHNVKQLVWQTSWAITTRSIGIMIMIHGDDKGLVIPPRVANIQVVIVPIIQKGYDNKALCAKCKELGDKLKAAGVKVKVDDRDNYSPGWKYNHWELKGVPLRLEVGPKDIEKEEVRAVRRVDGQKAQLKWDGLAQSVQANLDDIHKTMFTKAKEARDSRLKQASNWEEFMKYLNEGNLVLTPWCMDDDLEKEVKVKTGAESKEDAHSHFKGAAKTLCIPVEQEPIKEGEKCFYTGKPAVKRVLWGRSY